MSERDLVRMANQIAAFFASHPPEEAPAELAKHLNDFWTPEMRAELVAIATAGDRSGLAPLVLAALPEVHLRSADAPARS